MSVFNAQESFRGSDAICFRIRERNSSAADEKTWYFFQTMSNPDSTRGSSGRNTRSLCAATFRSLSSVTARLVYSRDKSALVLLFLSGKFKNSTDVDFFNPISLVHHDYLPFFLSETVEEPFFKLFCVPGLIFVGNGCKVINLQVKMPAGIVQR